MSQENVEIVRGHIEAYRDDDVSGALGFLDTDVVLDTTRVRGIDGTVAHGHEAVVQEVRRWMGAFERYEFEVKRLTDLGGGTVAAVVVESGRGKGSGAPVERETAAIYTVLGDKIVRVTGYPSEQAALEAAGMRE
jgi:ketosteroid isomerase-like protein